MGFICNINKYRLILPPLEASYFYKKKGYMKKIAFIGLIFFATQILFAQDFQWRNTSDFNIVVESEKKSSGVTVTIPHIEYQFPLDDKPGIGWVEVSIANNSLSIARIIWEKSTVFYNDNSYIPFLDGMKYVDAGKAPAISMIPKGSKLGKNILSSGQVTYKSGRTGWMMLSMPEKLQIILCIESNSSENYWTIYINPK